MENIVLSLKNKFSNNVEVESADNSIYLQTSSENVFLIASYLKENKLAPYFSFLTAVDYPEKIDLIYYLHDIDRNISFKIKTSVEKISPKIKSISAIYNGANYHEREVFDLFGVIFENHQDLRRIVTPDDFKGYPLRKDFTNEDLVVMK